MRIPLILILIVVIVCPAIDFYIRSAINRLRDNRSAFNIARWSQRGACVIAILLLAVGYFLPSSKGNDTVLAAKMWLLFSFATIYISKALFVIIDLIARIPQLFGRRRSRLVTIAGIILSFLLFFGMWYGALVNRFRIQTKEVEVEVMNLPDSFDGYRIVQISDLHTGTYRNDTTFLTRLVDRINDLDPDLVVFTGDIVNRSSHELQPHLPTLSRLKGRDGVYAILGNHDYGDYYTWDSPQAKQQNMKQLYGMFDRMGWHLLRNATAYLCRDNDSLAIIGVENIGDPPFPVYGSLSDAYPAGADGIAKILLSHNPAHWTNDISNGNVPNDIGLTLAGHTHAMQIELLGLSPAYFRYPTWGGLYSDGDGRNLYVNIGAGTVGLPMRLGATPEITVLTLRTPTAPSATN